MELTTKIIQELKSGKIQFEDLDDQYFVEGLLEDNNILQLLRYKVCSFEQIVDKLKNTKEFSSSYLDYLLSEDRLFEKLFNMRLVSTENIRYLFDQITEIDELRLLCGYNTSVLKYALNESMLTKEDIERFNELVKRYDRHAVRGVHNLFDMINFLNENFEEFKNNKNRLAILKLNELSRRAYMLSKFNLTDSQRDKLIEVLNKSEKARNILTRIVDNNLEDQYDFESLKNLLTKDSAKRKLKLNV